MNLRRISTALAAAVFLSSSCGRQFEPRYVPTFRWFEHLESVPIIVVARIEPGAVTPVGRPFVLNSIPVGLLALFRVNLNVENVVKGDLSPGKAEAFYITLGGSFVGPPTALGLYEPVTSRDVLLLRRERGELRTITDISRDCCTSLDSGSHLNYQPEAGEPPARRLIDLLLTRGSGTDDAGMVNAIFRWTATQVSVEYTARSLLRLAATETPQVRTAACLEFRDIMAGSRRVPSGEAQVKIAREFGISGSDLLRWRNQLSQNGEASDWWGGGLPYAVAAGPPPQALPAARTLTGLALCTNDKALGVPPLRH